MRKMFVPRYPPIDPRGIEALQEMLNSTEQLVVMTGAGCSTESGIPDYRSPGTGVYSDSKRAPIDYRDFLANPGARQRYWARNFVGWPKVAAAKPNITHERLAEWEKSKRFLGLVTQNVDGLHTKAGSKKIIEIHGSSRTVICLGCDYKVSRSELQEKMRIANPSFVDELQKPHRMRPDGDVELEDALVGGFKPPKCPKCNGILKPDVVFFGDSIPMERGASVQDWLTQCDTFLVLGSSLFVNSGYRLVVDAESMGKKTALVTIGEARGEHLFDLKLNAACGPVVSQLSFD
ncbi:unnamed protein product [Cyprideis torosa]|uniref:Uncharacterized protein n=1 Tax=Cyprideis torosa TaxID=163714 RepID=A0A7R8ZJN8_9CRUS|nr:unnamed protein product [Cyprideis torosa]CAG0882719.1 unnamed protein product [Cyprideis torosa]